jgi:integrase
MKAMIEKEENIKHKAAIMVGFSAGLRVGEIVNLKLTDIDTDTPLERTCWSMEQIYGIYRSRWDMHPSKLRKYTLIFQQVEPI